MQEAFKNSITVGTKNLKQVASAGLLLLAMNNVAQAENFYNDYATPEIAQHVSDQATVFGKMREAKIREAAGCDSSELRDNLTYISRHINVKGVMLDSRDDSFKENVKELSTSQQYKDTNVCGNKPTETQSFLAKKAAAPKPDIVEKSDINHGTVRHSVDQVAKVRDSLIIPTTERANIDLTKVRHFKNVK
jgi:hypothetical protein